MKWTVGINRIGYAHRDLVIEAETEEEAHEEALRIAGDYTYKDHDCKYEVDYAEPNEIKVFPLQTEDVHEINLVLDDRASFADVGRKAQHVLRLLEKGDAMERLLGAVFSAFEGDHRRLWERIRKETEKWRDTRYVG